MTNGRLGARVLATAVAVMAASWFPGTVIASAAPTAGSGRPAWGIVAGARLAPNNVLNGVAAVSGKLAWAVGIAGFSSDGKVPGSPVIERWNGHSWAKVRLPSAWPGGLGYVAASSARDAWVLGQESSGTRNHLLHWGGLHWREMTFPGTQRTIYANLGLTAAGGKAWLIATAGGSSQIFGWGGSHWRSQAYPCRERFCNLDQISARSATDAWAVGNGVNGSGSGGPFALHWSRGAWHQTAMPAVPFGYITGVFAVSRSSAWAVGGVFNTGRMLLFRWNGTVWRQVHAPAGLTAPGLGELTGITGDSAGHLWIYDFGPQGGLTASYLRYDGHRWSLVSGAVVNGQSRVIVRDVAPVPGTSTAWSVGLGFVTATVNARARIERYQP